MQLFLDLTGLQALLLPLGFVLLVRCWVASSLSQRHPAQLHPTRALKNGHCAALTQALLYGVRPYERWRLRHLPGTTGVDPTPLMAVLLFALTPLTGAGPTPAFLTGNIAEIAALGGAALAHAKFSQRYGPVYSTFGAPQPWVVTDSPALAHDVLLQHTVRPTMPSLLSGKDREFDRPTSWQLSATNTGACAGRGCRFLCRQASPALLSGGALLQHSSTSLANPDPKCMPPA
jgi:hypothetical protein